MWPWGHLAVGYLLYSAFVHVSARRAPDGYATVALALGTQFPDLVDKPLAWTFGVIPNGRSLAHSLIIAVVFLAVLSVLLRLLDRGTVASAFAIGYLSHLLGDALDPLLAGDVYLLGFLAWPLVPAIDYGTEQSFVAHLQELSLAALASDEGLFALLTFCLWLYDGAPGVRVVAAIPRWVGRRLSV
ncbi:metal-dependent hydrolase (plasmid) [Halorussus limi]|uniref:Metal-dependent hydrolase n=1 Tax=Halorussus limi TaxID=2938695 RepID=A0A8U0HZ48_9EURY|nr:metal-dependent hydrolase [Halorussus limi]UPV76310.1 metal-dependent hydrolase [Halorussus limi]